MALVNAFDSGPCQVILVHTGDTVFSGYLSKTGSSGDIPGWNTGGGEIVNIGVTIDGQVQFNHVAGSQTDNYEIQVQPDASFLDGVIEDISLPLLYAAPSAFSSSIPDVDLEYSGGGGAVTPDPATLTGATAYVGLFIGRNI